MKGCLKALASATDRGHIIERHMTLPSNDFPVFPFLALLTLAKPVNVMRFFYKRMFRSREFEGATCLCTATLSERAVFRVAACCM